MSTSFTWKKFLLLLKDSNVSIIHYSVLNSRSGNSVSDPRRMVRYDDRPSIHVYKNVSNNY